MSLKNLRIREARECDVEAIRDLFTASYGEHYCDARFYDLHLLKKFVFSNDTLVLVARDRSGGRLLGTASVIFEIGACSDLVGEFGRLVVHPSARHRGLGELLLRARVQRVRRRVHVGLIEARTSHSYSQRAAEKEGFSAVGFLPLKLLFREREDSAILVRYFGNCLELRRNHPRIIPEVHGLASLALRNAGIRSDLIVEERTAAYPLHSSFQLEKLTADRIPALLRIERGRVERREIFGPMRLHYGYSRLLDSHCSYLVARDSGGVAGAIGFMVSEEDQTVRVFELISLSDGVIRFLVQEMERVCREQCGAVFFEIDVSAHAPRMQKTLVELGFVPGAFIPAFSFHRVERVDVVKMIKLTVPLEPLAGPQTPSILTLAQVVRRRLIHLDVSPRVAAILGRIDLFSGLTSEQLRRLVGVFSTRSFRGGHRIFEEKEAASSLYIVLSGRVEVRVGGCPVGQVGAGECLGEVALLSDTPHSATALAQGQVEVAVLFKAELLRLIHRRPDVGTVIYRNLAVGLGRKLRRVDRVLSAG